ncbi:MAG: crotonobetainyl-CoA:carnitine CoA-transferase CaiB-like acyl-CoA transferase [Maribacter sp.]|jgi:crotonobetainyl-CoA:carnitine CoA-transferase CaiB-like acyl-CoA transferase
MNKIFEDLKIVELASVLAGPSVGMFFAELGAQVIKIENKKTGGDITRKWKLPSEKKDNNYSAYFSSINYRKKHLFLNLKNKDDYDQLIEIIKDADIVISNYRKKQTINLKLDYSIVSSINPHIIFATLTGFGDDNPRPAFDVVLQAEAGFIFMTGEPNRPPVKMPVALIDVLAAHQMKEGILIALLQKSKTGKGAFVEISLYKAALASLVNQATNWLMAGHIPQPMGTLHPNIAPYGDIFYSKDKKAIVLAVGTENQFIALCHSLKIDIYEEDFFNSNTQRVIHRSKLSEHLSNAISTFKIDILEKIFLANEVPYGRIRNMKEVFELPEAQAMILEEKMHDGGISKRVRSVAFEIK